MSFFYTCVGDDMKVYVDLILMLNFFIDFNILLSVSILLKRKTDINKILIGSFIGSLSVLFLFIKISNKWLFLYKIIMCFVMCIVSYRFETIKYTFKNFIFTYLTSFVLGGFLNYLNSELAYKRIGLIYYHKGISINFIFIMILTPLLLFIYVKENKLLRLNYNNYFDVSIMYKGNSYEYVGYLDSGNKVKDPIFKIPVIFIDKRKLVFDINEFEMNLVPITTANGSKLIKCFKSSIKVNNKLFNKVYVGIMDNVINIDGVDVILNSYMEVA